MLMSHPPHIIARGREHVPQGYFTGLTPMQVCVVVQELVTYDAEVQEALAHTLEAIQAIAQAGPNAFHRITVNTRAIRVTPSILTRTMIDRTMVIDLLYAPPTIPLVCCHINSFQRVSRCGEAMARRRK